MLLSSAFLFMACDGQGTKLSSKTISPPILIASIILRWAKEFHKDWNPSKQWLPIMSSLDMDTPWEFFDGASQGHPQYATLVQSCF